MEQFPKKKKTIENIAIVFIEKNLRVNKKNFYFVATVLGKSVGTEFL